MLNEYFRQTIEFVLPMLQFLFGTSLAWFLAWFVGIIDRIKNSTIKSTIEFVVGLYYRNNIDDFLEKELEERIQIIEENVEQRLERRNITVDLEEVSQLVYNYVVQFNDQFEEVYYRQKTTTITE